MPGTVRFGRVILALGRGRASFRQAEAHVDEIVGDHTESHPSLHAVLTTIEAPVQTMPPLKNADPAFTSRAPSLAFFKGSFFLMRPPLLAAGVPVRDRNIFYAHFRKALLVGLRVEARIGCYDAWYRACLVLVFLDRLHQERRVSGPLLIDFEMRDDLALGFLHLHQFAELSRFARFSLADDLGLWFEHAHQLLFELRVPAEYPRPRLLHHLFDSIHHRRQLTA